MYLHVCICFIYWYVICICDMCIIYTISSMTSCVYLVVSVSLPISIPISLRFQGRPAESSSRANASCR